MDRRDSGDARNRTLSRWSASSAPVSAHHTLPSPPGHRQSDRTSPWGGGDEDRSHCLQSPTGHEEEMQK